MDKFLIVGDIHGNIQALEKAYEYSCNNDLKFISTGDIVDYGKNSPEVFNFFYQNNLKTVMGNHDFKLYRYFIQRKSDNITIKINEELQYTIKCFDNFSGLDEKFVSMYNSVPIFLSYGDIFIVHAALSKYFWIEEKVNNKFKNFCIYGQVCKSNPYKENGFPNRVYNWVDYIPNNKVVLIGHDIISTSEIIEKTNNNNGKVIFMDTGCSKGGILSGIVIDNGGKIYDKLNFG